MCTLRVDTRDASSSVDVLHAEVVWDGLFAASGIGISAPDVTSRAFWTAALAETFLHGRDLKLVTVQCDAKPACVMAYFRERSNRGPVVPDRLLLSTSLFSGRCAIPSRIPVQDAIARLIEHLRRTEVSWGVLLLRTTAGSNEHAELRLAAERSGCKWAEVEHTQSPYVTLPASWDDLASRLPKSLRRRIRKGTDELAWSGALRYAEIVSPQDVSYLLSAVRQVEQLSWKQEAKTSITARRDQEAFYEAMIPLAAERGFLSAHLLLLNEVPVAYMLGLFGPDRVFLDLKASFDQALADHSPGHVLKRFAMEKLIARGAVAFDFMGVCDEHKMRWTSSAYEVITFAIFNRSPAGAIEWIRRQLRLAIGRWIFAADSGK